MGLINLFKKKEKNSQIYEEMSWYKIKLPKSYSVDGLITEIQKEFNELAFKSEEPKQSAMFLSIGTPFLNIYFSPSSLSKVESLIRKYNGIRSVKPKYGDVAMIGGHKDASIMLKNNEFKNADPFELEINPQSSLDPIVAADIVDSNQFLGYKALNAVEKFFIDGSQVFNSNNDKCRNIFINAIKNNLSYPNAYWNSGTTYEIGQMIVMLLGKFNLKCDEEFKYRLFKLAHLFLSRFIELIPSSQGPHKFRGLLFQHSSEFCSRLMSEITLNPNFIPEIFLIGDFYFSGYIEAAQQLQYELEDISVEGKDADEYSIEQLAKIGISRHSLIYEFLKKKFMAGELNIPESAFSSI